MGSSVLGGRSRCDQGVKREVLDGVWHELQGSFELQINTRYNADAVQGTLPYKEPIDIVGVCTPLRFLLLYQEMILQRSKLEGNDCAALQT